MKKLLLILLFVGAQVRAAIHISISLDVTGQSAVISDVSSYLHREIRSLGDVDVSENKPFQSYHVLVMENHKQAGLLTGYTLSVVVITPVPPDNLRIYLEAFGAKIPTATADKFRTYATNLVIFQDNRVYITSASELRNTCARIVTDLDNQELESYRRIDRIVQEGISKGQAQTSASNSTPRVPLDFSSEAVVAPPDISSNAVSTNASPR